MVMLVWSLRKSPSNLLGHPLSQASLHSLPWTEPFSDPWLKYIVVILHCSNLAKVWVWHFKDVFRHSVSIPAFWEFTFNLSWSACNVCPLIQIDLYSFGFIVFLGAFCFCPALPWPDMVAVNRPCSVPDKLCLPGQGELIFLQAGSSQRNIFLHVWHWECSQIEFFGNFCTSA